MLRLLAEAWKVVSICAVASGTRGSNQTINSRGSCCGGKCHGNEAVDGLCTTEIAETTLGGSIQTIVESLTLLNDTRDQVQARPKSTLMSFSFSPVFASSKRHL